MVLVKDLCLNYDDYDDDDDVSRYLLCCAINIHLEIMKISNSNQCSFLITYKINDFNHFLLMWCRYAIPTTGN